MNALEHFTFVPSKITSQGYKIDLLRHPVIGDTMDMVMCELIDTIRSGPDPLTAYCATFGREPLEGYRHEMDYLISWYDNRNEKGALFDKGGKAAQVTGFHFVYALANWLSRLSQVIAPYEFRGDGIVEPLACYEGQIRLPRASVVNALVSKDVNPEVEISKMVSDFHDNGSSVIGLGAPNRHGVYDAVHTTGYYVERTKSTVSYRNKALCLDGKISLFSGITNGIYLIRIGAGCAI